MCVFPVEGLVVFSTVGHSVTAGAGFISGTTTHPAQLHSRDRQHTLFWFRVTGGFILWEKKKTKKDNWNSFICKCAAMTFHDLQHGPSQNNQKVLANKNILTEVFLQIIAKSHRLVHFSFLKIYYQYFCHLFKHLEILTPLTSVTPPVHKALRNYTLTTIKAKWTNLVEGCRSRTHSSSVADFWKLKRKTRENTMGPKTVREDAGKGGDVNKAMQMLKTEELKSGLLWQLTFQTLKQEYWLPFIQRLSLHL